MKKQFTKKQIQTANKYTTDSPPGKCKPKRQRGVCSDRQAEGGCMESHSLCCWQKCWKVGGYRPTWQHWHVILAIGRWAGRTESLSLDWPRQRDPVSKNTTKSITTRNPICKKTRSDE